MELSYNDVEFKILTLDAVQRRLTYSSDGTSVLWVEWNILASCVYAPSIITGQGADVGGTSLNEAGFRQNGAHQLEPRFDPVQRGRRGDGVQGPKVGQVPQPVALYQSPAGGNPIFTDQEILKRLAVPRRPLVIKAKYSTAETGVVDPGQQRFVDLIWLQSPKDGFDRDANNGPIVKTSNVVQCQGQARSFGVQLEITTFVPPTEQDRLLLCHRWQMTHTRSEADYLQRTVQGEAVFHAGMLAQQKLNPGWFQQQLFHPIPPGFKRTLGPITLSPTGNVLKYEYHDVDQEVVFSPGNSGCTEVEVVVQTGFTSPMLANILEG